MVEHFENPSLKVCCYFHTICLLKFQQQHFYMGGHTPGTLSGETSIVLLRCAHVRGGTLHKYFGNWVRHVKTNEPNQI